jgi:putative ABC transport system permease protein
MKTLALALRLLRRDWRTGELRLLAASLVVAVAAVTAVLFFTDRVQRAMELQAAELLAADLSVETGQFLDANLTKKAEELGLKTARVLEFPSVVFQDQGPQLVQVKAVGPGYPLRGELRISAKRDGPGTPAMAPPPAGSVWVEPRLLGLLGTDTGTTLSLGDLELTIAGAIQWEPDRGGNLFRLAPRVMLGFSDLDATGLVGPASRVRHRFLVAGEPRQVQAYRHWLEPRLPRGAELEEIGNARPELRSALDQGGRFLALAALTAALLCGVAVALSTQRFVERQADAGAILRCLGASRRFVLQVFLVRLAGLGLAASLAGSLLGLLAQHLLALLVGDWFSMRLPPPSLAPLPAGIATGLVTLFGFALAPVLRLGQVSPLRVLRRDLGLPPARFWLVLALAALAFGSLMFWQAGDTRLALRVLGGIALTLLALLASARVLVRLLTPLRYRAGAVWRYGLAGLARNPRLSGIQLAGFGLGIMALLLLALVRVDLLSAWELRLPVETPNHFLINIQPDQVAAVDRYLLNHGLAPAGPYPMLRARLTRIGERTVSPEDYSSPRAQRLAAREFNLSWSKDLPADNRILTGSLWGKDYRGELQFSVEQGIAETLGIRLGDQLEFLLAGEPIRGPVTSLREVHWDSFNPNFFVIGSPGSLDAYPSTYITSFYLPAGQPERIADLSRQFPAVTVLDVSSLMRQVRAIMERGSLAVEYVFAFTLVAGVIVLYAGIQSGRELRIQESAVLRTLGLRRRQLLLAAAVEFGTLGLLAGLLAAFGASLIGYVLAEQVFDLTYRPNPWLWLAGLGGGALGIGLAGMAAVYPLLTRPPIEILRRA